MRVPLACSATQLDRIWPSPIAVVLMSDPSLPCETLAERLRAFRFEPAGAPPFADALARGTGWNSLKAQRVVEEYRRFLWIAGTGTDTVSPSPAIDRAWHLHLLDTRSYWNELCPKVLGRSLHHEPGRGDLSSRKQLDLAYRRTLAAYHQAFGTPPSDIWPPPPRDETSPSLASEAPEALRVRTGLRLAAAVGLGSLLPLVVAHGSAAVSRLARVSDVVLLLAAGATLAIVTALSSIVRRRLMDGPGLLLEPDTESLDRYELAYLRGGARGAIEVALAELVSRGTLAVSGEGLRFTDDPRDAHEVVATSAGAALRQIVLEAVVGRPAAALAAQLPAESAVRTLFEPILVAGRFVVPARTRAVCNLFGAGTPAAVAVLMFARVAAASQVGATTGFPLACLPIPFVLAVGALVASPFRTKRGEAALARRRGGYSLPTATTRLEDDDAELVALFGASALRGSALDDLAELLEPRPRSSAWASCGGCGG